MAILRQLNVNGLPDTTNDEAQGFNMDGQAPQGGSAGFQTTSPYFDASGGYKGPDAGKPAAPPAYNTDRQGFQQAWMGSSGSLDDFLKANPQFANVQRVGSDKVQFGNEVLDIVGDVGGANKHNWTGTGVGANGVPDAPSGPPGPPPGLFGSVNQYMSQSGSPSGSQANSDLMGVLAGLYNNGGGFNQGTVDRRTELAREDLQRQAKSRSASNKAALASRGTLGSGPELTAQNRAEEDIANQYGQAVSGIYADESDNADQRMMQALQLAAGMSEQDAARAVEWFKAQSDASLGAGQLALGNKQADNSYALGQGQLALGNKSADNSYNLGVANNQLGYDTLNSSNNNTSTSQLIDLLNSYLTGSRSTAGGYR